MPNEYKDKITDEDKKTIISAVEDAKKVKDDDKADKDALEKATKILQDTIMPIGAKLYQAANEEKPADDSKSQNDSKKRDKDEPVEGEVVDNK